MSTAITGLIERGLVRRALRAVMEAMGLHPYFPPVTAEGSPRPGPHPQSMRRHRTMGGAASPLRWTGTLEKATHSHPDCEYRIWAACHGGALTLYTYSNWRSRTNGKRRCEPVRRRGGIDAP